MIAIIGIFCLFVIAIIIALLTPMPEYPETEAEATDRAGAIAFEVGMVAAGQYMDDWRKYRRIEKGIRN